MPKYWNGFSARIKQSFNKELDLPNERFILWLNVLKELTWNLIKLHSPKELKYLIEMRNIFIFSSECIEINQPERCLK
jgi:hypothetical protein